MSKFLKLAIITAISLAIVSCDSADQSSKTKPDNSKLTPKILLVLKTLNNPFFSSIQAGAENALRNKGEIIVRAGKSETDIQGQLVILRSFIPGNPEGQKITGVIISPSSSGPELVSELVKFRNAKIPVILVDTLIPEKLFKDQNSDYNVGLQSDNVAGGRKAAKVLLGKLAEKNAYRLLMLEGASSSDTAHQRRRGFDQAIQKYQSETGKKFEITYRVANWKKNEALSVTSSLIGESKKFDAVFAANDSMALGATRAYNVIGAERPIIVGFDAVPAAISSIKSGDIDATIAQDPKGMGRRSVEILLEGSAQAKSFELEKIEVLTCSPECQ